MSGSSLTEQLQLYSGVERDIAESVLRQVLPKLREIAIRELHRERVFAPLSPTELINEVWLRNLNAGHWRINSREHFYSIAALAMRRVLIDFARSRMAKRRDGCGNPMASARLSEEVDNSDPETVLRIGMLLDSLEKEKPEYARVVDMHYFAGFTLEEITEITGLTLRQVRLRWQRGRDWLKDRL
jgi:RNA polymerase sigma factor (TIGR02999 family)